MFRDFSEYNLWILAKSNSSNGSKSDVATFKTFAAPCHISVLEKSPRNLKFRWTSPNERNIEKHQILVGNRDGVMLQVPITFVATNPAQNYIYTTGDVLQPGRDYVLQANVGYKNFIPGNDSETFFYNCSRSDSTQVTTPEPKAVRPGVPYLDEDKLRWNQPDDFVELYELEAKVVDVEHLSTTGNRAWKQVYVGDVNHWPVSSLDDNLSYKFRVRAKNSFGWSDFGAVSQRIDLKKNSHQQLGITIGGTLFGVLAMAVVAAFAWKIICVKMFKPDKERIPTKLTSFQVSSTTATTETNPMYNPCDITDPELDCIPKIGLSQIEISKPLGSGEFGEVYEGVVNTGADRAKVAIKGLRKDATKSDKLDFIQEAKAMVKFRHPHIVSIIGVCLESDKTFIILELMEGGDLLGFLRSSRSSFEPRPIDAHLDSVLTIRDMLNFSVDIASGCAYLEDRHFVHRDLAARNCLVSSKDPKTRKVKVGDFGLARDIYVHDYYRIGRGVQLPIRWMAPESMIYGVFTTQSDIWSFGVLMWEIFSLGKQPYNDKANPEVLRYVQTGGHLEHPEGCPTEVFEFMLTCWKFDENQRPSFKSSLEILTHIQQNLSLESYSSSIHSVSSQANDSPHLDHETEFKPCHVE